MGNSGNVIHNNNIFDYFHPSVTSAGIAVNAGCNTWSITNNRFYQTAPRTWTSGALHTPIIIAGNTAVSGAQGFTVTGNVIGFASSAETGTYTLTGTGAKFVGILYNGVSGSASTDISGNTIASVSLTGVTSAGVGTSTPFSGIVIASGLTTTNNNIIGSQVATGSMTFSTTTISPTDCLRPVQPQRR